VVAELTATGCGIGILPTRVATRASKPLRRITEAPVFRDELCVVVRAEAKGVAAIRYLTAAIKAAFDRKDA
jgi:DNA-binding transcriptional LysR family regulator